MLNAFFPIRKLISLMLICVLLFGITPITLLHSMVANHTDVCYHHFSEKSKQFSKADVNCQCFFFVAEAQFLSDFKPIVILSPEKTSPLLAVFRTTDFYSQHHFFAELRGPPTSA